MANKENEDLSDLEDVRLVYNEKQESSKANLETYKKEKQNMVNVHGFRVMNVTSLAFIFLGCAAVLIYSIVIGNKKLLYEFFRSKTHHFQMDIIFFHFCWGVILLSCVITISRMSWVNEADIEMEKEIYHIQHDQYSHLYYSANIFLTIYICLSIFRFPQQYGIECFIGFISLVLYYLVYHNYNTQFHTKSFYNFLAFDMNISFLFSWTLCLYIISLFSFLESFEKELGSSMIELSAFLFHLIISCINIVFIAYYVDVFFCFIILVYQIGIVYKNKTLIDNENKATLFFCLFSFICFIYTIFISKNKENKHINLNSHEANDLYAKFKKQKNESFQSF